MNRLRRLIRPATLLGRTAQALAVAFLLFGVFSAVLLQYSLVRPHTKQAADDLAAFLVLVAQIWVELPPDTRSDYRQELYRRHELRIIETEAAHPTESHSHSYLDYLEAALSAHIQQPVYIHRHPAHAGWLWADFPMGGRIVRIGFKQERLQDHIFVILPLLAAIGLFIAFALSFMLVRRVTRPLAVMTEATRRIGDGDFNANIPETGPREIADLARRLNLMENRISELVENRTTLLAGISHDLRTPLARMRLELELLSGVHDTDLVEGLQNNVAEMEKLIAQTLLLARGLSGEDDTEIDVNALIDGVAEEFRGAGNTIDFQPVGNCMRPTKVNALRRVLANLIENALAYSGGKTVMLRCENFGTGMDISVIDEGPGIPQQEHQAIFQPFYRLENSRSRATGGSGLGLAVVNQLCRTNGWDIEVLSPTAGGTVFRVHLPASNDDR